MKKNLIVILFFAISAVTFISAKTEQKEVPMTSSSSSPGLFRATANSFGEYAKQKTNAITTTTKARVKTTWEKFKNLFTSKKENN